MQSNRWVSHEAKPPCNAETTRSRRYLEYFQATIEPTRFRRPGKMASRGQRGIGNFRSPHRVQKRVRLRKSVGRVGFETKKTRNRSEDAPFALLCLSDEWRPKAKARAECRSPKAEASVSRSHRKGRRASVCPNKFQKPTKISSRRRKRHCRVRPHPAEQNPSSSHCKAPPKCWQKFRVW